MTSNDEIAVRHRLPSTIGARWTAFGAALAVTLGGITALAPTR